MIFIPDGDCYLGNSNLIALHLVSDAAIALACYTMAISLIYLTRKLTNFTYINLIILFVVFFSFSSTTHLLNIWTILYPHYWLSGIIKALTALISLYIAIILPFFLSREDLELKNNLLNCQSHLIKILNISEDAIISLDTNQHIILFNQAAEKIFGWQAADIINKPLDILFPQPLIKIYQQKIQDFSQKQEIYGLRQNGQEFLAEISIHNLGLPQENLIIFLRDISQQKQAEIALKETEERYKKVFEEGPLGMAIVGLNYQLLNVNNTLCQMLGYTASELMEKTFPDITHPDDLDKDLELVAQLFEQKIPYYRLEKRYITKNKEILWIMLTASLLCDKEKKPRYGFAMIEDISERKQTEAILQQYQGIVSATSDAIVLLDQDYKYKLFNQSYLNWYQKTAEEIFGHSKSEVLGELVFNTKIKPYLDRCLSGEILEFQDWFELPNLGRQFLSATYSPYLEEDQSISGVVIILRNITKLKQIEELLELQNIIVNNMAEGVCLVSASNADFVYANPKFEQMFGYELGELKGKHVSIVNYEDETKSAEAVNQEIRTKVLQNQEFTYEVHNVKKDGTPFWCRATTTCFNHPDYGSVLVAVHQDIDDRKQAQEALQKSEQRLKYLISSSPVIIFGCKPYDDFGATYMTENVFNILGYHAQSFLDDSNFWIDRVHPDDREGIITNLSKIFQQDFYVHEYRFLRADGYYCWLLAKIRLMRDEQGKPLEALGYLIDITERKEAEVKIAASLQEKEVLLKEIHHRVKNNLQVIYSLLNLQIYLVKDRSTKELLQDSQNRIRSMSLVHEKLYRSKNIASINLADYLNDLVKILVISYKNNTNIITFKSEVDPTIFLNTDTAVPCGLIFNELISNAYKHAFYPGNKGEIFLKATTNENQELTLIVRDNGKGLPKDFNFDQVQSLGLQLVKLLTNQLKGKIIIEENQGTQFKITFNKVN